MGLDEDLKSGSVDDAEVVEGAEAFDEFDGELLSTKTEREA